MEMVASVPNGSESVQAPFQRHDVQEWSSRNRFTGMLEHARVETDHWTTNTQHSAHNYGKVVDSRNLSNPDGSSQQRARRQLEVFQAKVPGGSVQVIRTQTVASTKSRWTSADTPMAFEDLKLTLNPLDTSSQKTKANVGRSGSIGGRRPPSRPRSSITVDEDDVTSRLERVSRLCQQLHDETLLNRTSNNEQTSLNTLNQPEMTKPLDKNTPLAINASKYNSDNSSSDTNHIKQTTSASINSKYFNTSRESNILNPKSQVYSKDTPESIFNTRNHRDTKNPKSFLNSNPLEHKTYQNTVFGYLRSPTKSVINPPVAESINPYISRNQDITPNKLDNEPIRTQSSSTNSYLSRTTLGKLNNSRTYLDSDKSNFLNRTLDDTKLNSETDKSYLTDQDTDRRLNTALRGNNVDLEALDQILKLISFSNNSKTEELPEHNDSNTKRKSFITIESLKEVKGRLRRLSSAEEVDDGIVDKDTNSSVSKVRSYVYGMEAMLHKKPILGTGSLESRTSSKSSGSNSNRTEDWYNRRKSYGFEQVHNQQIDSTNCLRSKNKIESSTDSGICRSTEIVPVPKAPFVGMSTVVNLSSDKTEESINDNELFNVWNRRAINDKDSEQVTIKIPISDSTGSRNIPISSEHNGDSSRQVYHRQMSEGTSVSIESWPKSPDNKRHSIAVDESKYVYRNTDETKHRRTSLAIADYELDDESLHFGRKPKRVEFCKTEVHFAAESGRVNIVETDEKPPPTQNFRRRRRTNSTITSNHIPEDDKTGLPLIHFGDEKKSFGDTTETFNKDVKTYTNDHDSPEVTVSVIKDLDMEACNLPESDNPPRSILKNKLIKPKPYILGDTETEDDNIWGVRLRPVHQEVSPQIWRSTVTVQNTGQEPVIQSPKPEFQKLLHSLRPSRKSESSIPSADEVQKSSPVLDLRRSSWSVADRVKQVEDLKETKGYSTKVNFGSGEATVIENNDSKTTTWPRTDDSSNKDQKLNLINKGLVVRIGREDSNHTVCSKTTTNQNATTTTTKITIDLSPSPTNVKLPVFNSIKLPRASLHSLKSTSLIMNTFTKPKLHLGFPKPNYSSKQSPIILNPKTYKFSYNSEQNQLESLHFVNSNQFKFSCKEKLQTETHLEALKETCRKAEIKEERSIKPLASGNARSISEQYKCNRAKILFKSNFGVSSESPVNLEALSRTKIGSLIPDIPVAIPDKLAALKKLYEEAEEHSEDSEKADEEVRSLMSGLDELVDRHEAPEEVSSVVSGSWSKMKAFRNIKQHLNNIKDDPKQHQHFQNIINKNIYTQRQEFQSTKGTSSIKRYGKLSTTEGNATPVVSEYKSRDSIKESPQVQRKQMSYPRKGIETSRVQVNSISLLVGTTKRDTEMVAARRIESPNLKNIGMNPKNVYGPVKPVKNNKLWNKPDLLQHYNNREYVNLSAVIQNKKPVTKKVFPLKRPDSPIVQRSESPIYENIDEVLSGLHSGLRQESAILEELTRAADQILQAVNGYTDEDSSKLSSDEDKKHRMNLKKSEALTTISETKSWKTVTTKPTGITNTKTKVKGTSSNSSMESLTREAKPVPPVRMNRASKLTEDKNRKKITGSNSELSKVTKARRLQRASSREALLQSHGSSSEDITSSVEVRKPRLTRRAKPSSTEDTSSKKSSICQLTKKKELEVRKSVDRAPGLQEIRHKTAVSTIKSTAEKAAIRGTKSKNEDLRKKISSKKDTGTSKGLVSSQHGVLRTGLASSTTQHRGDLSSTLSAIRTSKGVGLRRTQRQDSVAKS